MNLKRLIEEANAATFRKNTKRLLRRYFGNILFHRKIIAELREKFSYVYDNYVPPIKEIRDDVFYIWCMWWQGREEMPEVIKICYNSILQNAEECEVVLITANNYQDYVALPDYIIQKYKNGIIPIAQFSDVIRFSLLSQKGGVWLDATTLVTDFQLKNLQRDFFTLKFKTKSQSTPTGGKWAITLLSGSSGCALFDLMEKLLWEYWKKEDTLMKYFLTDYLVLLLYTDVPSVKEMIDRVSWSSSNYLLKEFVNEKYSQHKWETLISNTKFHTLSRKVEYNPMTSKGDETFYGYLLRVFN